MRFTSVTASYNYSVQGEPRCLEGRVAVKRALRGGRSPSHRLHINGVLQEPTIPQGELSNLCELDPRDIGLVR